MIGTTKQGLIGVDIGAGAIKIAQVIRRRAHLELVDAAIVPRANLWSKDLQRSTPKESIADEIRAGLSLAPCTQGRIAAGVFSMSGCEFHALHIPDEKLNSDTIQQELVASAPLRWSERTYDSWSIPNPPDTAGRNFPNLGVMSLPRTLADAAASDFSGAGLNCQQFDATPTAISRILPLMIGRQDAAFGVVDLGYESATFSVIRRDRPHYVRRLKNCAFADILMEVCEHRQCTPAEAFCLMTEAPATQKGNGVATNAAVAKSIARFIHRLEGELNRTIEFLQSHRRHQIPAACILLGAGSMVSGLSSSLAKATGLRTELWRPDSAKLIINKKLMVGEAISIPITLLAPAIAASMLAWEKKQRKRVGK